MSQFGVFAGNAANAHAALPDRRYVKTLEIYQDSVVGKISKLSCSY
jgi:hypothetical protein